MKAICDAPGHILIKEGFGWEYGLDVDCAKQLVSELSSAIHEAEKPDPFQTWWTAFGCPQWGTSFELKCRDSWNAGIRYWKEKSERPS